MRLRLFTIAAVLLAVQGMAPQAISAAESSKQAPIENFEQVSRTLSRGASPSCEQLRQLCESGVKTIVDLRLNGPGVRQEESAARNLGLIYLHLPLSYKAPTAEQISKFLSIVCNPQYLPVFVHCRQGADRTGVMVAIYQLTVQRCPFDEVYRQMRQHGFKPWLRHFKTVVASWARQTTTGQGKPLYARKPIIESQAQPSARAEMLATKAQASAY